MDFSYVIIKLVMLADGLTRITLYFKYISPQMLATSSLQQFHLSLSKNLSFFFPDVSVVDIMLLSYKSLYSF